jgi:hypothetical protein
VKCRALGVEKLARVGPRYREYYCRDSVLYGKSWLLD